MTLLQKFPKGYSCDLVITMQKYVLHQLLIREGVSSPDTAFYYLLFNKNI